MKHSKASLFLMELIISIFFFSLAGTVCIQMFVKAHSISRTSSALNKSNTYVENLAECYRNFDGDLTLVSKYCEGSTVENGSLILILDENYKPCDKDGAFEIKVTEKDNLEANTSGLKEATIEVFDNKYINTKGQTLIYSLDISKYIKKVK